MKYMLLPVLVLCVAATSLAQVRQLTPDEAVRLGLEHNERVRTATADATAAHAALRRTRAGALPALRGQASYTRLNGNIPDVAFTLPGSDSTFTFQAVEPNRYTGELSLQQSLFTGNRLRNEVRAAEHDARAAELRVEQEQSDVAFDIRRAYWELFRARALREALTSALARVDAHLGEVQHRVSEGAALRRDLLAAQTRRSEVQLELVSANNDVRVGQLELSRLLGLPLDSLVQVRTDIPLDTTSLMGSDTAAVMQRPQLRALLESANGLRAQLRAAEGDRWPQVDFIGRYVYARPNPYFFMEQTRFHYNWELGFSTRWNLWEGGRRGAQSAELSARITAAEARLAEARRQAAVDHMRKQLEVARAREALGVAAENVSEAEETYRVARAQFAEGAALSSDVLDAERAYRQAQARQAQARADYEVAVAALRNMQGRT